MSCYLQYESYNQGKRKIEIIKNQIQGNNIFSILLNDVTKIANEPKCQNEIHKGITV